MLKQILTGVAFIFVGLLPSVRGDEGLSESHPSDDSSANLIVGFKENCPDFRDPLFCYYWYSNELSDLHPAKFVKSKATSESTTGKEIPGKDSSEIFTEFPENHQEKRFLIARKKNPSARGFKRGPGFRSWGGKRDSTPSWQNPGKRTKFGSWGGKRDEGYSSDDSSNFDSEERAEKRAKFQNWGGKRNTNDLAEEPKLLETSNKRGPIWKDRGFYLSEPFKKTVPKRPQFQSWGGKRDAYPWSRLLGFFRTQSQLYPVNGGEKRKFSSWGGKRYEKNIDNAWKEAFQNWEGKKVFLEKDSSVEGPKKFPLDDDAMQISTITTVQRNWKNNEPPFMSTDPWQEKAGEDDTTR